MNPFRDWPVLALLLAVLPVANAGDDGDAVTQAQVSAAITRGLDWIERHPASLQDGGLTDILDEGVGFRVLSMQYADPSARKRFSERFVRRMTTLAALPAFTQWVTAGRKRLTDYYHLVLAAWLMQQAGKPTELQPFIVAQAQWVLANSPHCDATKRLTIALFLERLDEEPVISLPSALAASRIERIAGGRPPPLPPPDADPQRQRAAALELYALVHEIVALTDFGNEPAPPWLAERRVALQRYLLQAIAWAGTAGNFDLLSELLLTALFIEAPVQDILPDMLALLVSSQQADGSWGAHETIRSNTYRHAVFTATTALRGLLNADGGASGPSPPGP
jgi:hypothetical protein